MTVYFAWVAAAETTFGEVHHREDEQLLSFEVAQDEGELATLTIEIKNPREGLLTATRKQWAWLSWDDGSTVHPLFFGRVMGVPEGQESEELRLRLVARPSDFEARKETAAASLRNLPWFDPVWVHADRRGDPDAVLEARSELWHVDRTDHSVTTSDILAGEAGTIAVGAGFFRDSLQLRYVRVPRRKVEISAEMQWDQTATGEIVIDSRIGEAAQTAGTARRNVISSYTGDGLVEDWPQAGAYIGGGWSVAKATPKRVDGTKFKSEGKVANSDLYSLIYVPLWTIQPKTTVAFDVSRRRIETAAMSVNGDIQAALTDDGADDRIVLEMRSASAAEGIDGAKPIGDAARRSWFQTDRGRQSLEHLVLRARARLRSEARAAEIVCGVDFATAIQMTCRHSVSLSDARLPGGAVTGKLAGYRFGWNGDRGERSGEIRIGLAIGNGGTASVTAPVPAYVADGYVNAGYQAYASGETLLPSGDVGLGHYGMVAVVDDGIIFGELDAETAVRDVTVVNGQTAQEAILDAPHADAAAVISALNAEPTQVQLEMINIDGHTFQTDYAPAVTTLKIPMQIDLGAA